MNKEYNIWNLKSYLYNKKTKEFNNVSSNNNISNSKEIADFIHNNKIHILTNKNLLKNIHNKIINEETMIQNVLKYEFLNYNPDEKIKCRNKLHTVIINELNKYQRVVGGFYIEDDVWIEDIENKFITTTDKIILYNSFTRDINNETETFMNNFINLIKRQISCDLEINYKIFYNDNLSIHWIVIYF